MAEASLESCVLSYHFEDDWLDTFGNPAAPQRPHMIELLWLMGHMIEYRKAFYDLFLFVDCLIEYLLAIDYVPMCYSSIVDTVSVSSNPLIQELLRFHYSGELKVVRHTCSATPSHKLNTSVLLFGSVVVSYLSWHFFRYANL